MKRARSAVLGAALFTLAFGSSGSLALECKPIAYDLTGKVTTIDGTAVPQSRITPFFATDPEAGGCCANPDFLLSDPNGAFRGSFLYDPYSAPHGDCSSFPESVTLVVTAPGLRAVRLTVSLPSRQSVTAADFKVTISAPPIKLRSIR